MPPKRQTSQQKLNEPDIDVAKQQAELRRQKIDAERIARMEAEKGEKMRREQEELVARKKLEEERAAKQALEEQQRLKEEEERRRKQEEDEVRRAAEERKKKMEADRRRQLEEQALRAEEERKRLEQERLQREQEELKELEELKKNEPVLQVTAQHKAQPDYDLLAGEVAETHDEPEHHSHHVHHHEDAQEDMYSNYSEFGSSNWTSWHRQISARGEIDSRVDEKLDSIPTVVKITKTGKTDGTYLFGSRVMRTKLDKQHEPQVVIGASTMGLEQFIRKFEKVETTKLRGLVGASPLIQFMTAKSKSKA